MKVLWLGLMFDFFEGLGNALTVLFEIFRAISMQSISDIVSLDTLMNNIYIVVSICMLFYISINLMTYLASPDKLSDRSSGGSKLLIRIVVTLALLVFTPTVFDIAMDFQRAVVSEDIIAKIVIGAKDTSVDDDAFNARSHDILEAFVLAFLQPKEKNDDDPIYQDVFFIARDRSMGTLRTYAESYQAYDFNWVMAIIATGFMCIVLFNFLFDISIRLVKLGFMQMIAPLPILTYPFSNKQGFFNKWMKDTVSTYISLFVRIAIIYFAIFIIGSLSTVPEGAETSFVKENPVISAFVIIGALLFAKQLPKLVEDLFGIKGGSFSINPMRRVREVPLLGSAVQATGAALGGVVTGAALGYRLSGGTKGIYQGFKNGGFKSGMKNLLGNTALSVGKTASLSAFYGGRAGWQQTSVLGTPAKQQKIDKTAYRAGATAVAQAITGSDKAVYGISDRVFNSIGTELNKPNYAQSKVIEDAQKDYDKAVQDLNTSQDSYNEIASKHSISSARVAELQGQMSTVDTELNTFRTNKLTNRATMIANETTKIDNQIAAYQTNRQSIINDATADITAKQIELRGKKSSMSQSQYNKQYTALEKQKTAITSQVNTAIDNEITNLQVQKNTISTTIDNKLEVQENEIVTRRDTISRNLSTEQAEFGALDSQLSAAKTEVANNTAAVATAKANVKTEKDKLKEMNGPYMKNK